MIWMCESIRLVDQSIKDPKRLKIKIKINHTKLWSVVLCLLTTNQAIQNNWFSMHPTTRFLCILQLVPLILHLKSPISHNLMELIRKQLQIYPYIFQKSMIKSYACNNSCSLSAEIFYYHPIDCFRQNKKLFQKLVHLSLQQKSKFAQISPRSRKLTSFLILTPL